jgi:hypothetical protein
VDSELSSSAPHPNAQKAKRNEKKSEVHFDGNMMLLHGFSLFCDRKFTLSDSRCQPPVAICKKIDKTGVDIEWSA